MNISEYNNKLDEILGEEGSEDRSRNRQLALSEFMNEKNQKRNDYSSLGTVNDQLNEKYGVVGTDSRMEFDAKSEAWYLALNR